MSKKFKYKKGQSVQPTKQEVPKVMDGEFLKQCVKCGADYRDNDPDPYWCESCNAERKALAREIDKKVGSTVGQRPNSEFKNLDAQGKEMDPAGNKAWYYSNTPAVYKNKI